MQTQSSTREIPLSQGLVALVDEADFDMVSRFNWAARRSGRTFYATTARHCRRPSGLIYMHRMLLLPAPDEEVDHVNGDGLDNRRCNLRLCTHAENGRNQRRPTNNTSGVKGVSWNSGRGRWEANIKTGGVSHFLGYFDSIDAAARAYDAAALAEHGEFARLHGGTT
mgnify:FL=1